MAIYPVADMLDYKQIDGSTWDKVVEKFPFLARVLYYMFNIQLTQDHANYMNQRGAVVIPNGTPNLSDETKLRLRGYGVAYAVFLTALFGVEQAKTSI